MVDIIKMNGLIPVPISLDSNSLEHDSNQIERELDKGAGLVVLTYLFGSINCTKKVSKLTKKYKVPLVEDCAQSFCGNTYLGDQDSDLVMHSFGPIKTNTALGGAIFQIKDTIIMEKMKKTNNTYPQKDERYFAKRITKFILIKCLSSQPIFGILNLLFSLIGKKMDKLLYTMTRGLGTNTSLDKKIQFRLSRSQEYFLKNRLHDYDSIRVPNFEKIKKLNKSLGIESNFLGMNSLINTYWLLPLQTQSPEDVIKMYSNEGHFASRYTTSLVCLNENSRILKKIVFLPKVI
jgi:dTDP-4-amino-4,6-dideoxygalactose transaminase